MSRRLASPPNHRATKNQPSITDNLTEGARIKDFAKVMARLFGEEFKKVMAERAHLNSDQIQDKQGITEVKKSRSRKK